MHTTPKIWLIMFMRVEWVTMENFLGMVINTEVEG